MTALERDYNDVIDRYPRLYVSADFAKIICAWVQVSALLLDRAPPCNSWMHVCCSRDVDIVALL